MVQHIAQRLIAVIGCLLAGAAVALGAYHAHGLQAWLANQGVEPAALTRRLDNAEIAVRYQMVHALALVVLGSLLRPKHTRLLLAACSLMCLGTFLFCGGLYLIVFTGSALHWSIVPAGGVVLIAAWIVAAVAMATRRD